MRDSRGAGLVCGWSPAKAGRSLRTLQSAPRNTKAAGGVLCLAPRWCSSPSRADSSGGRSKDFRILGMAGGRAEGPRTRSGAQSAAESGSGTASSACSLLPRALSRIPKDSVRGTREKQNQRPRERLKQGQTHNYTFSWSPISPSRHLAFSFALSNPALALPNPPFTVGVEALRLRRVLQRHSSHYRLHPGILEAAHSLP